MATRRANGEGTVRLRADGRYEGRCHVRTTAGDVRRVSVFGKTHKEARDQLLKRLQDDRQGVPIPAQRWTVERYLTYWLEQVVRVKNRPRTAQLYEGTIRRHIVPYLGKKSLINLTVADVQGAINQLQANGVPPRSIHAVRQVLSSALGRAEKDELVSRNVARLVDLPHYERKPIRPWDLNEARRFLRAIEGHRWEAGYRMLVMYGMRRGEVLGLRWGDIDFAHDVITVEQQLQRIDGKLRAGPVKTTAGRRTLPLLPSIRNTLLRTADSRGLRPLVNTSDPRRTPIADEPVIATEIGTPVEPGNFAQTFQTIAAAAGLPRITVHHTRHTAATLLKHLGVSARDAQLILGHSSVTTTQELYQHADVELQRVALTAVVDALTSAEHRPTQGSTEVPPRPRRGQPWGSTAQIATFSEHRQANENRRSTGVESADFVGGPGGARTLDILLKRQFLTSAAQLPTPVVRAVHTRAQRIALGRVGVRNGVNLNPDELQATLRFVRAAQIEKLRQLSFPLNLLATTPLNDPREVEAA